MQPVRVWGRWACGKPSQVEVCKSFRSENKWHALRTPDKFTVSSLFVSLFDKFRHELRKKLCKQILHFVLRDKVAGSAEVVFGNVRDVYALIWNGRFTLLILCAV